MAISIELLKKIIFCYISSLAISIFPIYYWHILLGKKLDFKNKNNYIGILILSVVGTLSAILLNNLLKMIFIATVMIVVNYFLFSKEIKSGIISSLISWFIFAISEIFLTALIMKVFPNIIPDKVSLINLGIINFITFLLAILISRITIFKKLYDILMKITSDIKKFKLFFYVFVIISVVCVFTVFSYYELPIILTLIVNSIISFLYMIIIFQMFKAENNYQKIYNKYTTSLSSLKEYEQIMEKQKLITHENKNHFLTIKAMILSNEKNIDKYIDAIVKEKIEYNEQMLHKLSKIPEGGLRAIMYAKLNKMNSLNINYDLYLSKKIASADMFKISEDTILDICKITGVFLDNAIEAVQDIDDGKINIDMYMDGEFICIEISNNYTGNIEISSIEIAGYTTKNNGHGYGLSLVRDIINKNPVLKNEKQLTNEYFTQILKIKM